MTHTYPRTVDNGAGETLTFLRVVPTPEGDRLEIEGTAEPGSGPPLHIHHLQEEGFAVVSGRMGYRLGDRAPQFAGPGERAVFPPGVPHTWWNAGSDTLRMTGWIVPADNAEYFLAAQFDSLKRAGGTRPGLFDSAFLMTRYRSEFDFIEIPAAVRAFALPMLAALGRVLGLFRRYADAPEPVLRRA